MRVSVEERFRGTDRNFPLFPRNVQDGAHLGEKSPQRCGCPSPFPLFGRARTPVLHCSAGVLARDLASLIALSRLFGQRGACFAFFEENRSGKRKTTLRAMPNRLTPTLTTTYKNESISLAVF